jgi:hypothetical protein
MSIVAESAEGIEITWLAGGTRVVPLLTFDQVKELWPEVDQTQKEWLAGTNDDAITLPLRVILSAMQQNYPDLTISDLEANLTTATLRDLWQKLWSVSYLNMAADESQKN